MPSVEVRPDVFWIGLNDRTTDLFEGIWPVAESGVTYNSYLIRDTKNAIAYAVMRDNCSQVVGGATVSGA